MNIIPVIMAGGAGTRLWPLSREERPKQFHNLSGKGTLMHETITRLLPITPDKYVIVTSHKYEKMSLDELSSAGVPGYVLSEPKPKNTAAAILYATAFLDKLSHESIMIVLPADHYIHDNDLFIKTLRTGIAEAEKGKLVSIGIKPTYPETGYGYIKAMEGTCGNVQPVDCFVEKPDLETAKGFCDSGNYYWNSGIFIWKTTNIFEAFIKHLPDHVHAFEPLYNLTWERMMSNDPEIWKMKEQIFDSLKSVSIDYGIMEKAANRVVIPGEFGWADLGSWKSIDGILEHDENMNRTPAPDKVIFVNSGNCSVFPESEKIAVVGLSNVIVVQAGDAVLVIDKESTQDVRKVVDILRGR